MAPKNTFLILLQGFLESRKKPVPRLIPAPSAEGLCKSFDGTHIFWERHGPSPEDPKAKSPLIFCYGLVCSMNQWRYQIERYKKDHPIFLFDYRGHHRSELPSDPRLLNIAAVSRDLAAVINSQNIQKPVHIWGHSMGVNVALEFAVAEPEKVKSLVLCCGAASNPFERMFNTHYLDKFVSPLLRAYEIRPDIYHGLWALFQAEPKLAELVAVSAGFNAEASKVDDREAYARAVANIDPKVFFPLLRDLMRGQTQNILRQIKSPSFVIAGGKDLITPPEVQKKMAEQIPGSEYTEIALGSHNVQVDFGEYLCLKVEEFWKSKKS